jgi:hypothetical protein
MRRRPSSRLDAATAAAPQISHARVRFERGNFMDSNVGASRALGQEIGGK